MLFTPLKHCTSLHLLCTVPYIPSRILLLSPSPSPHLHFESPSLFAPSSPSPIPLHCTTLNTALHATLFHTKHYAELHTIHTSRPFTMLHIVHCTASTALYDTSPHSLRCPPFHRTAGQEELDWKIVSFDGF
jgi:hypothetical protein